MTWVCGDCGAKWHSAVPRCCSCDVEEIRQLQAAGDALAGEVQSAINLNWVTNGMEERLVAWRALRAGRQT